MVASTHSDMESTPGADLEQLIAHVKGLELDEELALGDDVGIAPPDDAFRALILAEMRAAVRALVKRFLVMRPGASLREFMLELRKGRVPSAGLRNDANPRIQQELAEIIAHDPSFLDFV